MFAPQSEPQSRFLSLKPLERLYADLNKPTPKRSLFSRATGTSEAKILPQHLKEGLSLAEDIMSLFYKIGSASNINGEIVKQIQSYIQAARSRKEFAFLNPFLEEAHRCLLPFLKYKNEQFDNIVEDLNKFIVIMRKGGAPWEGDNIEQLVKQIRALKNLYTDASLKEKEAIYLRLQAILAYALKNKLPDTIIQELNIIHLHFKKFHDVLSFEKRKAEIIAIKGIAIEAKDQLEIKSRTERTLQSLQQLMHSCKPSDLEQLEFLKEALGECSRNFEEACTGNLVILEAFITTACHLIWQVPASLHSSPFYAEFKQLTDKVISATEAFDALVEMEYDEFCEASQMGKFADEFKKTKLKQKELIGKEFVTDLTEVTSTLAIKEEQLKALNRDKLDDAELKSDIEKLREKKQELELEKEKCLERLKALEDEFKLVINNKNISQEEKDNLQIFKSALRDATEFEMLIMLLPDELFKDLLKEFRKLEIEPSKSDSLGPKSPDITPNSATPPKPEVKR